MTKYVEWVQPNELYPDIMETIQISVEDAIKVQRRNVSSSHPAFLYRDDAQALDDFVCGRWAKIVEEE